MDGELTGGDLHSPTIRLLASIIKIARDDWEALYSDNVTVVTIEDRRYCDKTHKSICDKGNFTDGEEELLSFFYSEWFEKICSEIGFSPDETRALFEIE